MSLFSPKEFFERFGNDLGAAKKAAFQIGQKMGQVFLRNVGMKGNDLETVAAILNEFQRTVQGEPSAKVEGGKVTMRCMGFCPIMRAALTLNIPWVWLDTNYAWPLIQGIASIVIPEIKMSVPSAKSRGDSACVYVFEK